MKILTTLGNYPQVSETYVTAEIGFLIKNGIQVEVWSPKITVGAPPQVKVHRGNLQDAVRAFVPDIVHCHYLHFAPEVDAMLGSLPVPMTVRGHSYEFGVQRAEKTASIPRVKRIYLFPHFARLCTSDKIRPLSVAYDSSVFEEYPEKDRKLVLRLSAAKRDKGLRDFLATALLCPDYKFILGIADVADSPGYFEALNSENVSLSKGRAKILHNVPWETARDLTRRAGIYLGTSDPSGHAFGMPVSFAEALATGSLVLMRNDVPAAKEYLHDGAMYYGSPAEAATIIRESSAWEESRWDLVRRTALARASLFADNNVFPSMINDWHAIVKK